MLKRWSYPCCPCLIGAPQVIWLCPGLKQLGHFLLLTIQNEGKKGWQMISFFLSKMFFFWTSSKPMVIMSFTFAMPLGSPAGWSKRLLLEQLQGKLIEALTTCREVFGNGRILVMVSRPAVWRGSGTCFMSTCYLVKVLFTSRAFETSRYSPMCTRAWTHAEARRMTCEFVPRGCGQSKPGVWLSGVACVADLLCHRSNYRILLYQDTTSVSLVSFMGRMYVLQKASTFVSSFLFPEALGSYLNCNDAAPIPGTLRTIKTTSSSQEVLKGFHSI